MIPTTMEKPELIQAPGGKRARVLSAALELAFTPLDFALVGLCIAVLAFAARYAGGLAYLRGVVAFSAVLLSPGYCAAWACNLLGFRARSFAHQIAWALVCSFGLMGTVSFTLARFVSVEVVLALCILSFCTSVALIGLRFKHSGVRVRSSPIRQIKAVSIAVFCWIAFVAAELLNVVFRGRMYVNVAIFDLSRRAAFVDAVMRTGVPPANPLFWPGHAVPMRYYYFWNMLTAAAAKLGSVPAAEAMIASVAWAGLAVAAVVFLYCHEFLPARSEGAGERGVAASKWSRPKLAILMLSITGLDLIPTLVRAISGLPVRGDMEWWSMEQITSWMDSILWVPHHVAGVVCCLFGFLLVWMSQRASTMQRISCAVFAGLSFASCLGLSTWVALGFGLVMLGWAAWVLLGRQRCGIRVLVLLAAALVGAIASSAYVRDLSLANSAVVVSEAGAGAPEMTRPTEHTHLLGPWLRHFFDLNDLRRIPAYERFVEHHPFAVDPLWMVAVTLALMIPGYAIELGFYGMILVLVARARRTQELDEASRTALFLITFTLLLTSFVGSTVIPMNDFGSRALLIAQFFLLLLGVRWIEGTYGATNRWAGAVLAIMFCIGVAGSLYQVAILRAYISVQDRLGRPFAADLGHQLFALHQAFDAMDGKVPRSAVVQFNSLVSKEYVEYADIMMLRRQMAAGQTDCGTAFGGTPALCEAIQQDMAQLFSVSGNTTPDSATASRSCAKFGIDYLVASRWDRAWANRGGWVWQLPAAVDTGDVRVLRCSNTAKREMMATSHGSE